MISALKVKLDRNNPKKIHALKAILIFDVWNYVLNKESIYNIDEFLSVVCVTRSTFKRIVSLVKENPVLQGQTSEKQSKHFMPEIHFLATFNFFYAEGNQGGSK